jgi:methyl coenzyme M reductase beta subunit
MKKEGEKEKSVFGEILGEIPEFKDPIKAVAEGAKEIMQK